jgi:hypothetical protein
MTDPIFYRLMVLLAKIEGTYATDPTLTGAANGILAQNISVKPMEGQDVPRNLIQAYLSGQATIPAGLYVDIEFDTELAGSGTAGTPPGWGIFARAAGCAEVIVANTSVSYTPISDGATMESLYLKFWLGTTLHAIKGARADATLGINAQGIPSIRWSVRGLFVDPADVARATPTLTGFIKPLIADNANTPAFTVNSVPLVMRSYSFKFGNKLETRFLIGRDNIPIVDRAESIDVVCEATPLGTFNPYALAKAQTRVPVSIVHGITAGNIITLSAPTSQVKRPTGYQNNQGVAEWPLGLSPLPTSGNDQFSLALT